VSRDLKELEELEVIKKILKQPLKLGYSYRVGFFVSLYGKTVYISNKFANQFENEDDARLKIFTEFALSAEKENEKK